MSNIYVMQRANGDIFSFDHQGRLRVPLFRSSSEAMTARSRNVEMLLFKPVVLNGGLLSELVPASGGANVDLWLVKDPFSLKRGDLVEHSRLAMLIASPSEAPIIQRKKKAVDAPRPGALPKSGASSTEIFETVS